MRTFNRARILTENFKPFWSLFWGKEAVTRPPSKDKELLNIGHNMGSVLKTKKPVFERQQWSLFQIWFIMTLHYKMWHITKSDSFTVFKLLYDKMRQFYYKMWQFLQNAMVLSQNATVITTWLLQTTARKKISLSFQLRTIFPM